MVIRGNFTRDSLFKCFEGQRKIFSRLFTSFMMNSFAPFSSSWLCFSRDKYRNCLKNAQHKRINLPENINEKGLCLVKTFHSHHPRKVSLSFEIWLKLLKKLWMQKFYFLEATKSATKTVFLCEICF